MSPQPVTCSGCGKPMIWLPYAHRLGAWIPVEPQSMPTSTVPEASRWAWRRGHGLIPLAGEPALPAACLVIHPCAAGWSTRGSRGGPVDIGSALDNSGITSAVDAILARGREHERQESRRAELARYKAQGGDW